MEVQPVVEAVAVPVEGVPVEAVAVPAPQGQQTLLSATVPAGVGPGMPFIISAPNGASVMVTCPPGAVAGQQVQIPFNAQPERRITGTVDPQDEQHGQCCEPGGPCGPPIPPRQQLEADGTISVLRITYYCEGCCGPSQAFKKRDMPPNIPGPLREIGVTESEWSRFVSRLEAEVQPMRDGKCNVKCWCCLFIGLFTLCLACPIMCKMDKEHIMAWDSLLRKWQADFNAQVLEPKGSFCKTQSLCWVTRGSEGEKQRHFHRWIAVAITPAAIAQLKSEPHLMGDIEECTCCGGINEHECCMHPRG